MGAHLITIKSRSARQLLRGQLVRTIKAAAFAVEASAKIRAPKDTSHLASSIQANVANTDTTLSATVDVGAEYGLPVETGSRPHDIIPRKKKALAWPGGAHPVGRVHHPGAAAQPFMRPAAREVKGKLGEIAKGVAES